jgi:hypothetical protein
MHGLQQKTEKKPQTREKSEHIDMKTLVHSLIAQVTSCDIITKTSGVSFMDKKSVYRQQWKQKQ